MFRERQRERARDYETKRARVQCSEIERMKKNSHASTPHLLVLSKHRYDIRWTPGIGNSVELNYLFHVFSFARLLLLILFCFRMFRAFFFCCGFFLVFFFFSNSLCLLFSARDAEWLNTWNVNVWKHRESKEVGNNHNNEEKKKNTHPCNVGLGPENIYKSLFSVAFVFGIVIAGHLSGIGHGR